MPEAPARHAPGGELSARALGTGLVLGGLLGLSNLFVGLKAGWAVSVAFTACLLAFAGWRGVALLRPGSTPLSQLECNTVQTVASAAAFAPVGLLVSAWPAWLMLGGGAHPAWLLLWLLLSSLLGFLVSIPTERQFLEREQLPFPGGVAVAETVRNLYREGAGAAAQARSFFGALGVGAAMQWCIANPVGWWPFPRIPEVLELPLQIAGRPAAAYTVGINASLIFLAAGALVGLPVATWMLFGSTLAYVLLPPPLVDNGVLAEMSIGLVRNEYAVWAGAALMVSSALFTFLLQLPLLRESLRDLGSVGQSGARRAGLSGLGLVLLLVGGLVAVGVLGLSLSPALSLLSLPLLLLFTVVACRATGETDIAPVGALGKLGQLGYGIAAAGNSAANLMGTGAATTGAAAASDWLLRRKAGLLLGAHGPSQRQAYALGLVAGCAMMVPLFLLLVPDPAAIGDEFLAPAAQVWASVARIFEDGVSGVSSTARTALLLGTVAGPLLVVFRGVLGPRGSWAPHPMGIGMGMILVWHVTFGFFLGAALLALWQRARPVGAGQHGTPVAGGLIAGESLMGVLLAALVALGVAQG